MLMTSFELDYLCKSKALGVRTGIYPLGGHNSNHSAYQPHFVFMGILKARFPDSLMVRPGHLPGSGQMNVGGRYLYH